jgi:hypothetical protein
MAWQVKKAANELSYTTADTTEEAKIPDEGPEKTGRSVEVQRTSGPYIGPMVHLHVGAGQTCGCHCNKRIFGDVTRLFDYRNLSTFQEVPPTLERHVVAIFVTSEVHVRLGRRHQSMFNLSQQCLLLPTYDVQVSQEVFLQESITIGSVHQLVCEVTNSFSHILRRLREILATARMHLRCGWEEWPTFCTITWKM